MIDFKKRFVGKWVLAGEYSVLRSHPALVYPLPYYYMDFDYKESDTPLKIKKKGEYQIGLEFSITPLFEKAFELVGKTKKEFKGTLTINGAIPFGAGVGASAVICAGMASLFLHKKWISKTQLTSFSTSLEDFFHGKSSGMDITVVLKEHPVLYQKEKPVKTLPKFKSRPLLFLSYSGGRSSTAVGVSKVKKLCDTNWNKAQQIDQNMEHSVNLCLQAAKQENQTKCNALLTQALTLAESCFHEWQLISYELDWQMTYLKKQGAVAVKPTGSGMGGHVISLWNKPPPASIKNLIPLEV